MTKEKQLIAFFELDGWVMLSDGSGKCFNESSFIDDDSCVCDELPELTHEYIVKVLDKLKDSKEYPFFQSDYVTYLRMVVERDLLKAEPSRRVGVHWFEVLCATAEQQCEAILLITGKYTQEVKG